MGILSIRLSSSKLLPGIHSLAHSYIAELPNFEIIQEDADRLTNSQGFSFSSGENEYSVGYTDEYKFSSELMIRSEQIESSKLDQVLKSCRDIRTSFCSVNIMSNDLNYTKTEIALAKKGILDSIKLIGVSFAWITLEELSYYQKNLKITVDELLAAPFYRAERLEGDRILIQISKDIHATEFCQEYYDRWVAIHKYFKDITDNK